MATAVKKKREILKKSKAKKSKASKEQNVEVRIFREGFAVVLLVGAAFVSLALLSTYSELDNLLSVDRIGTYKSNSDNMMGPIGEEISNTLVQYLGWCSFVVVLGIFVFARRIWQQPETEKKTTFISSFLSFLSALLLVLSTATFVSVIAGYEGGGEIGGMLAFTLVKYVGGPGTLLISLSAFILAFSAGTGISAADLFSAMGSVGRFLASVLSDIAFVFGKFSGVVFKGSKEVSKGGAVVLKGVGKAGVKTASGSWEAMKAANRVRADLSHKREEKKRLEDERRPSDSVKSEWTIGRSKKKEPEVEQDLEPPQITVSRRETFKESKKKNKDKSKAKATKKEQKDFVLPSPELLSKVDSSEVVLPDDNVLIENSRRLESALSDFKVGGRVVEVQPGPIITLYHFQPAAGVKVQRVINLADDLALALKVNSVRVYAPVPGKGTIGIEVPNETREMVKLYDVLSSSAYKQADSSLTLCLGKDTFGSPFAEDLARMPHLLIAGATGTGKSVCINSLLLSLLYRNTPEELKLILIDPKMLELSMYADIPHLKAPVVTNPKRARGALWWAVEEMERRYRLMMKHGVRNLSSFNHMVAKLNGEEGADKEGSVIQLEEKDIVTTGAEQDGSIDEFEKIVTPVKAIADEELEMLPRIVIVVDELADLMLTVGREVEELFARLAQKARAAGIHLILATQRPSVNVITGLIKANFPARLSFKVASRIDSRTVLDASGAEKLLGDGDMLFMSPRTHGVRRLHGAFVSDKEVADVVDFIRDQRIPDYDPEIEKKIEAIEQAESGSGDGVGDEEYDELYDKAVELVVEKGQASTSMVQRAFRIGYNRAARILEVMEREGVVGAADGSRPRQVLVPNRE